jgi:hypothetical protein
MATQSQEDSLELIALSLSRIASSLDAIKAKIK